jgi:hypothetical protein
MVANHQAAVRDFETHVRSHGNNANNNNNPNANTGRQKPTPPDNAKSDYARDTDTIAFANETLPTLKHHLEMAQNIDKGIKAGTPVSSK